MPFGHVPYHTAHELTQRLNRIAGFSMRSLKFLKNNNFDLSKSFDDGCFFLGRHEEKVSRQWVHSLQTINEQPSNDNIDLSTLSTEYNNFYARARLIIEDMLIRPGQQGVSRLDSLLVYHILMHMLEYHGSNSRRPVQEPYYHTYLPHQELSS